MESEILFKRSGYEYRYRIGVDEEMISLYREREQILYSRSVILEVRTNFILKKSSSSEEILESERFASIHPLNLGVIVKHHWLDLDEVDVYRAGMSYRLEEYWLPEKEIELIAREAMCFVKRTAAADTSLDVIPVVVYIDVFTLQLQGELLNANVLRLIKPDRLIPFRVWGMGMVLADETWPRCLSAMSARQRLYLLRLPRERVEDVAVASARMESCPICWEAPTYGTRLTPLPDCDHVFHNHCIVRWLMNDKNTCPVCSI